MALITISEAGRLTGKGRPAIYAAIKAAPPNNLSVVAEKGKTLLDPAEVERVFGPFKNRPGGANAPAADSVPADQAALIDALRDQIEQLKAAAAKAEAREAAANERALAAESRAAAAEEKADDYLIRLLPAPEAQPQPAKGFFARLFGG